MQLICINIFIIIILIIFLLLLSLFLCSHVYGLLLSSPMCSVGALPTNVKLGFPADTQPLLWRGRRCSLVLGKSSWTPLLSGIFYLSLLERALYLLIVNGGI